MRAYLSIILGLALAELSGCQTATVRQREVMAAAETADSACKDRKFKKAVELAQCRNDALRPVAQISGSDGDLINVTAAQRLVLAEKVDRKEITQAEADLEMAKAVNAFTTTSQTRGAQNRRDRQTTCATRRLFNTYPSDCD